MEKRLVKQILYGAGYLTFFFLVVFFVYLIWLKPAPTCFDNKQNQGETGIDCGGPCSPCEIKTLLPIEAVEIKKFAGDGQTILVAEIKNPNLNWAASFSYAFNVLGEKGAGVKTLTKDSYIYAGEIKYLFETAEVNPQSITDIKISFSDVSWKTEEEFPKPEIQIRGLKTEMAGQEEVANIVVSGFIANNNAFNLSKVRIIAFLLNRTGVQIGASKTELENIRAFEEKSFKINFPKNISLITTQTTPLYNFTRDLTVGSKGEEVKKLQEFLKEQGLFEGEITDSFNLATKNALIKYQKNVGISPASGYFGPKTRSYINSLKSSTLSSPGLNEADPAKTKVYVEALR